MLTNSLPTAAAMLTALLCACATRSGAQNTIVEPALPSNTMAQGYFPTLGESALMRSAYNARSGGAFMGTEEGTDVGRLTGSDLFPYEDSDPDFYQRNQNFFRPLNQTLGWLTPQDAWTTQFSELDNTSLTLDGNLGILTRQFAPELSTVKAGPLYLDLLWLGAGALWTDYNGNVNAGGYKDGVIAYVDVGARGVLKLSDSLYISAVADLMYLPITNRFALRFGGTQPALLTRLNYSKTIGPWDILLYDEFRGQPSLNWYGPANVNGYDRAGRYFYGFQTSGPTNSFQNSNYAIFTNTIGASLSRLVFDNSWRLWIAASHMDFWRGYGFKSHQRLEHIGAALGYEGSRIPFAPRFSYDMYAYGRSNTIMHQFVLSLTGRLTENLNWLGRVGETFYTGSSSSSGSNFIWNIDLRHTLTKNTSQSFGIGQTVFNNSYVGEAILSRYVQYSINHRINSRSYGNAFIQYADSETNLITRQAGRRTSVGVAFNYQPLDFTQLNAAIIYEKFHQSSLATDRWRYTLTATQQLGMRLTGSVFYQYEDYQGNSPSTFSEHVIGVTLRRYF